MTTGIDMGHLATIRHQRAMPIVIEVSTNRGWKTDFNKLRKLVDETVDLRDVLPTPSPR